MNGTGPSAAPTVLVLGGGTRLPRALRAHGCHVLYGGTLAEFGPGHQDACDEALLLSGADGDAWLDHALALHKAVPFDRVVTVRERFLTTAARIRDALGLPGNPPRTVLLLKDKARMREALADAPGAPAVQAALMRAPGDLAAFAERAGLPVVLKPRDGSGSQGIHVLRDTADVERAARLVEAAPDTLLAEEFLAGPEYSVESFSRAGEHHVLAVTEKFTGDNAVEIGHLVPARVDAARHRALEAATSAFLDAVGLTDGPAHTEIIVTPRGPRVVESHDRPGGDGIIDLVREVTGADVRDLLAAHVAGAVPPAPAATAGAAAVWFLTAPPGPVTEITGEEAAAAGPGVVDTALDVAPGDTVPELRGSDDRCGWVLAVGDDPGQALARARAAAAEIRITTRPVPGEETPAP
ncbi:ATP-grasp domain-containing protein [Streptomyces sp. NPDC046860]|uniref:ATP-grasp domain-containing protein n=1 Tax=Streptomyces sp. NPDC046860 TaxID=3154495 RepID=UPI0034111E9B